MRQNNISKNVLALFISGLLLTTLTPALGKYFNLPDFLKGFLQGIGLVLEFIALIKMRRHKKHKVCG